MIMAFHRTELTGPDRWRRCLQSWSSLPPRSTHGIDKPRSSCQLSAPCTHGRSRAGFSGPVLQFHDKSHPHRRRGYEDERHHHDHCAAAETKLTQGSPSRRKLWWPSAWTHCCDCCYHLTRSLVQNVSACGHSVIPHRVLGSLEGWSAPAAPPPSPPHSHWHICTSFRLRWS